MNTIRTLAFLISVTAAALAVAKDPIHPPQKDRVSVTVGQKLTIQFKQKGKATIQLIDPTTIEKPDGMTPSVTLDFTEDEEGILLLHVQNDFDQKLQCQLLTRAKGSQDFYENGKPFTVTAGLGYVAGWNGVPIEEVVLWNPVLLPNETP